MPCHARLAFSGRARVTHPAIFPLRPERAARLSLREPISAGSEPKMLLQQLVNGLTLGAVYTLIALAFSLVMGILSILNLAVGELFMFGGYVGFAVIAAYLPLPIALLAGMAAAAVVSIVIQKIAYEPLRDAPLVTPMLSTL